MADTRETLCLLATLCFHFPSNVFQYLVFPFSSLSYVFLLSVFSLGFREWLCGRYEGDTLSVSNTVFPFYMFILFVFPISVLSLTVISLVLREWLCGPY